MDYFMIFLSVTDNSLYKAPTIKWKPQQAENNEHMQGSKDHSDSLPECPTSSWLKNHPNFL